MCARPSKLKLNENENKCCDSLIKFDLLGIFDHFGKFAYHKHILLNYYCLYQRHKLPSKTK